jgi:tRNA A-37 threonylcarbamoyl transferase component Bud32
MITLLVLLAWIVVLLASPGARRLTDRVDAALLRTAARLRNEPLTNVLDVVDRLGSSWAMTAIGVMLIVSLVVLKRWRHLFTFLGSVLALQLLNRVVYAYGFTRPRPYDVTTIGQWSGYSLPAVPVAVLTTVLIGISYSLVPAGRLRTASKWAAAGLVGLLVAAELYLATFHPFDVLMGVVLAVAVPLNAFRTFTPNEVFPVSYRRRKTAHLDVGGRRGEALRRAVRDQLGLVVTEIQPIGLHASGGSTPLRLRIQGEPDTYVFGKLYAMSHVRADRWYKFGRTILYGRLEDEAPFQSVRRLVQYEDYAIRLLQDVGIPTATPLGVVEMTPEREYLLVTEFFDGAVEIGEAPVDDQIIDEGLLLIRRLWDSGLAHRDIKPANLLVRNGHLVLIDLAFLQVRPSPWREAVDLANMMLVLAVRTDAERVYRRALRFFTADEIAEAFAAARGIASPSQLRTVMKRDGRDLLAQFRSLAPERRPVSLQSWGIRRFATVLALLAGIVLLVPPTVQQLTPARDASMREDEPACGVDNLMILMAQAVPTAEEIPCIASLPAGWQLTSLEVRDGMARFAIESEEVGRRTVDVRLLPPEKCHVAGHEIPSDETNTQRFDRIDQAQPGLRETRWYTFPGGCVTYRLALGSTQRGQSVAAVDGALSFEPRRNLVEEVRRSTGLRLCGAGARCPGGS